MVVGRLTVNRHVLSLLVWEMPRPLPITGCPHRPYEIIHFGSLFYLFFCWGNDFKVQGAGDMRFFNNSLTYKFKVGKLVLLFIGLCLAVLPINDLISCPENLDHLR